MIWRRFIRNLQFWRDPPCTETDEYTSERAALNARADAANLALRTLELEQVENGVVDIQRLFSLCVFFESFLSHGYSKTEETMSILSPPDSAPSCVLAFKRPDAS